ncbi:putative CmcJ-like methyltransferase [Lasiosphaeria ovina]|uniref:CmcJ-like methyltransferase n=1 Tax=Lasiosphaeria ovina TaxID=92902 RepID=A0AAE0NDI7_9PEZI|nr:putative CmcJ-like methyltransferase [Lasiosphaeria ovina]
MSKPKDFTTTIQYISRDPLYQVEKAYSADFVPDNGETPLNHIFDLQPIHVKDIVSPQEFELDVHGFCLLKAKTMLSAEDALTNQSSVEMDYINEIEALLYLKFPEYKRIEAMNFIVRNRDARYPSTEEAVVTHEQPAGIPHADFSREGGLMQLDYAFPGQLEYLKDKDYDLLNVWRPLTGPNDDWPLAVCDWRSVQEDDIILNDDLHRTRLGENSLLHPNPAHKWYYLSSQMPEDVFIFRNTDSTGKRARCFHAAVYNPESRSEPRRSAEVRVVAIR